LITVLRVASMTLPAALMTGHSSQLLLVMLHP
jgi:hypothetical protein